MQRGTLFAALLLMVITSCRSVAPVTIQKEASSQEYRQIVNPFPVFDADGNEMDYPFLGGLNAPRPQFVDIDSDGDNDLFLQENTGDLMFFEFNESDVDSSGFPLHWQTKKYQNLDIGEWFRFVDLDQDGDFDLLSEQPYSYIRYYRNEGTPKGPNFVLAADSLKDTDGEPIFSDRQNIPNVTDIDNDGFLDLFIGRLDGTLTRYESIGRDENEIPQFELVTERFENIEIVKQFGTLHGANTMAFMDIDEDGDQDIFWGDFFEPSVLLLENRGNPSNPDFQNEPRVFPENSPVQTSGYNAPTLTDWSNDGDADLFLGVLGGAYNANQTLAENFLFYEQLESGRFELRSEQFLGMLDVGNESIPSTGDINGDGLPDLMLANKIDPDNRNTSIVYLYINRGTETEPELHAAGTLNLPEAYHYAPVLADLDGDGLADMMLGRWRGQVDFYRNIDGKFELSKESAADLPRGSNAVPELGDLDNDGDMDLLLGASNGRVFYFENRGTAASPDFQFVEDALPGVEVRHRSTPALHDVDKDGDLDLFVGSKVEGVIFFRNSGSREQPVFNKEDLPINIHVTQFAAPHFVDLNGDGLMEFLSGNKEGGLFYFSR
jgi:hypothetical protein